MNFDKTREMEQRPMKILAVTTSIAVLLLLIFVANRTSENDQKQIIYVSGTTNQEIVIGKFNETCVLSEIDEQFCDCVYQDFEYTPEQIQQLSIDEFKQELYESIMTCKE